MAKTFKCTFCPYTSIHCDHFKRHMRTHTGEKPYKCSVCSYTSIRADHVTIHMRTHTGEKLYKCSVCSYTGAQQNQLKLHMCTHTGEKPYKCDQCSYASSRKDSLQVHMRTHTGDKPYKCSVCSYAATNNQYLQVHMRIHTGEKPYKCNMCSYAAAQASTLKNHMRHHSGECRNGSAKRTNSKARNNAIESAASSGIVLSTKRPPTRLSFSNCLIPASKILQETSHDFIEIPDMNPAENNVNDNISVINLDSDDEQANENDEINPEVCGEGNQMTKPAQNETSFQVKYTENGHFDFDDGEGQDNGISKERHGRCDEDTCAIQ